jgi:hypothetical protein
MRGYPPLQLIIAALGLALVAIPLAHLTSGAARPPSSISSTARSADAPSRYPAIIHVRFAHAPLRLRVLQGDRILLAAESPTESPVETEAPVQIASDAPDFSIEADWPPGTPETAVTLEIEPDGHETRADTAWSVDGQINRLFHLEWK